jgi:hypothetical protein
VAKIEMHLRPEASSRWAVQWQVMTEAYEVTKSSLGMQFMASHHLVTRNKGVRSVDGNTWSSFSCGTLRGARIRIR